MQYRHEAYDQFYVTDPKQRHISKASVRDRLVHQVVYSVLSEVFELKFIFHSFSSRPGKGTHVAVTQLRHMIRKVSKNGNHPCFALKMDIKRFFDTINHQILKTLLRKYIADDRALQLIDVIIDGFHPGIPLGNVTSQLFANVYLHELDDFIKQTLREKYYLRYCDDFIILSDDKNHLTELISVIREFLREALQLELHPKKVSIRKLVQGIDFVGYVLFAHHTLVRARTKRRMKKRLQEGFSAYSSGKTTAGAFDQQVQSYLGILSHANQHNLSDAIKNAYWVRNENGF